MKYCSEKVWKSLQVEAKEKALAGVVQTDVVEVKKDEEKPREAVSDLTKNKQ